MKTASAYNKFWVALAAVLLVLGQSLSDGVLTAAEIGNIIIALSGAIGVYVVPNK